MSQYKLGDVFDMRDPTCSSHAKGQITRHFRIGGIEKYEVALLERSIWSGKWKMTHSRWDLTEEELRGYIIEDVA